MSWPSDSELAEPWKDEDAACRCTDGLVIVVEELVIVEKELVEVVEEVSCPVYFANSECKSGHIVTYDPTVQGGLLLDHRIYFLDDINCDVDSVTFTCNMVTTGVTDLCTTSNANIAVFDKVTGIMNLGQSVPPGVS